ncbi:hypothetical protein RCL1_006278 [Eukaryota sp. TZLM3-RCL]
MPYRSSSESTSSLKMNNSDSATDVVDSIVSVTSFLYIPRTCLFHSLTIFFKSQSSQTILYSVTRSLSLFGNVSVFFRSLLLEVLTSCLSAPCFSLQVPKSISLLLLLEKLFPHCNFCITAETLRYPCGKLPNDPFVVDFTQGRLNQYQNAPIFPLDDLKKFFENCSMDKVSKFSIKSEINLQLVELLSVKLPVLTELKLLDFTNTYGENLMFPLTFSRLSSLTCLLYWYGEDVTLDVSQLSNLNKLQVSLFGQLTGLCSLVNLKELSLSNVNFIDGLHPSARLNSMTVFSVSKELLDVLFQNRANFTCCSIQLKSFLPEDLVTWGFQDYLRFYSATRDTSSFSTTQFPMLERIDVRLNGARAFDLELLDSPRLTILNLYIGSGQLSLFFGASLYFITELCLSKVNSVSVSVLLNKCPYLKRLTLVSISDSVSIAFPSTLKYLEFFDITKCIVSCKLLPLLPRLKSLTLTDVHDVDSMSVTTKCSTLQNLYLFDCLLIGSLIPNYTVKSLHITLRSLPFIAMTNYQNIVLSNFCCLERISLNFSLSCHLTIEFPQCVSFFKFDLAGDMVKHALNSLPNVFVVSGNVSGPIGDDFAKFIADYQRSRARTLVSLKYT